MQESVLTYLDQYCERAGQAGLMGEPLNAITNLFFILASVLTAHALMKLPKAPLRMRLDLWLLTIAMFAIGIGSGLWHLVPTQTTLLLDVIPITLFINIFIIASLRRLFQCSWAVVGLAWATYFGASIVAQKTLPPDLLNGTIMYIPTYLTLVIMTIALWFRDKASAKVFILVVLVWSLSLVFRTMDIQLCQTFESGTHFLWHTLNAWVLWRLSLVLVSK